MENKTQIMTLRSRADVNLIRAGAVVDSQDAELLKECLRHRPASIDPTHVRQFYRQEGLVQLAKDAGIPFSLPLLPLLHSSGNARAKLLHQYRRFIGVCRAVQAPFWLVLEAQDSYDQKTEREWEAVATTQFGLTSLQARACLKVRA